MNIINDKQTYNVYVARKMTKLKQTWIDIQEVSLQYSLYCDLWSRLKFKSKVNQNTQPSSVDKGRISQESTHYINTTIDTIIVYKNLWSFMM